MSYHENTAKTCFTVTLTCDARKGRGVCGESITTTCSERQWAQQWFFFNGWRLLRGHQVCPECAKKAKVSFAKKGVAA